MLFLSSIFRVIQIYPSNECYIVLKVELAIIKLVAIYLSYPLRYPGIQVD